MKRIIAMLMMVLVMMVPFQGVANANTGLYSVLPVLPDNQDEGIGNYISVTETKNLNQTFEFVVTNKVDEPLEVKVNKLNGLTSPNGTIQYLNSDDEENSKIIDKKYAMVQYMEIEEDKFTLRGGESKVIRVTVNVEGIPGTVLGGIGVQAVEEGEVVEKEGGQFKINNEVNTVIGIVANFDGVETDKYIIGEPYVDMMPAYYAIRVPVTFDTNRIVSKVILRYDVKDKKGNRLFGLDDEGKQYSFAPKTLANIPLPWRAEDIKKGETYNIKGTFTYTGTGNNEKVVEFDKDFVFTGENTRQSNGEGVNVPDVVGENWYWILLLLLLLVAGVITYLIIRKKKKEYVYYSDDIEVEDEIVDGADLSEELQELKTSKNEGNKKFAHIYIKSVNDKKQDVYKHVRTEKANK